MDTLISMKNYWFRKFNLLVALEFLVFVRGTSFCGSTTLMSGATVFIIQQFVQNTVNSKAKWSAAV